MPRINLLPWREERRKELQQEFIVILVAIALCAGLVWFAIRFYHQQLIDIQNARISYIEEQIKIVDKKIQEIKNLEKEKENLLSRMNAIEQLQGNRPLIVRLFDELVSSMPEGLTLTSIEQSGSNITVSGLAQSNARVSAFMRQIDKSEWLADADLTLIEESKLPDGNSINSFTLTFSQKISDAEDEDS